MARGSGWARIAPDCERSTCAKSSRGPGGSGGSRDGREQLALPAEFVGEIERRVAVAQQADVPYGEQALGLRHAQLLEREGEPDALQDRDRRGELGEQRLRERQDVFLLPYERLQPAAKVFA